MNWVPPLDMSCRGSSVLDRVGAALGEQGCANMPCKAVTAVLGGIGRRLKTGIRTDRALKLGFTALSLVAGARN